MIKSQVKKINTCRICKNRKLKKIINLGSTPPANAFLTKGQLKKRQRSFPLVINFCLRCSQLQLSHVVSPELLFRNYVYASSTSPIFVKHFEDYAQHVYERFKLNKESLVIDIGSNDGILLKPFKKLGVRVLGIDPAQKIARRATQEGITTLPHFFNYKLAQKIVKEYGKAHIVTANNTFAHLHDHDDIILGVKELINEEGAFIIEVPYLIDLLEQNLFDTIYHEHLSYLSVKPLTVLFNRHKMEVFDVQKVLTHGGSIRVFVKNTASKIRAAGIASGDAWQNSVRQFLAQEAKYGLNKLKTHVGFSKKIEENKNKLKRLLNDLKQDGKKVVGYGAPGKSTTLLNYFQIDRKILDYIVDDSPYKQGLFTPGTKIPVVHPKILQKDKPDYVLILAWNFAQPIMEKLSKLHQDGCGFIVPVPTPTVIREKRVISKKIVEEDIKRIVEGIGKDVKKLEGKTLLISGGAGFLGSYMNQTIFQLNENVLKRKCKVISIDNYITGSEKGNLLGEISDKNIEFIYHDVRLPMLIREDIDYIIHAAGLASPYYYQKYPIETIESTVLGAKNLLELARLKRVKSFLFFSSSEIYGNPELKFVPIPETYAGHVSSVGPRACYDESKRLGETLCLTYHQQFNVPIKIVRPFNVYGPGMKTNDYRVIPTFLYKGLTNKDLLVHGQGNQTRTFCYATDATIGFFKVLLSGKNGEIYNVGNERPEITMFNLASKVASILDNGVKARKIDYPDSYPAGEPQRRCPNLSKIKSQLGYTHSIDLDAGLKRCIEWYRSTHNL